MVVANKGLWSLVWGKPEVDPTDLVHAVEEQAGGEDLDYRTRLLVRDSLDALREHWGEERLRGWLAKSPNRTRIEAIWREDFDEVGFPTLKERIVEKTDPNVVRAFLQELGSKVRRPVKLAVGGSIALILRGHLSRATEDIDVVDEVPPEIRELPGVLNDLKKRYALLLAHFQRHYLAMGWEQRMHFYESFGPITVYLLDVYDVFLSKLFSARTKDRDDLRQLAPQLDKERLIQLLKDTTSSMLASESLRQRAEQNWSILFGEALPA